jgi:hypothetical protein
MTCESNRSEFGYVIVARSYRFSIVTCAYDPISLHFEPLHLSFHLLIFISARALFSTANFSRPKSHPYPLTVYIVSMHHPSKIHSTSVVPRSHRPPKVRLLYQNSSSVRFLSSLHHFQCDLKIQMNNERKPRAICRDFTYQGVCDNMQCPLAHVPYQNMVRSIVNRVAHSLHDLLCFPSSFSLNFF